MPIHLQRYIAPLPLKYTFILKCEIEEVNTSLMAKERKRNQSQGESLPTNHLPFVTLQPQPQVQPSNFKLVFSIIGEEISFSLLSLKRCVHSFRANVTISFLMTYRFQARKACLACIVTEVGMTNRCFY
jgi:hypothetical protein